MQIFYAPDIDGNEYILDETESRHCIRVLRMTSGTVVNLIDGEGNLYKGVIKDPDQRACSIEISQVIRNFEKRPYYLHLAISPLKNTERFEWFVEKSVEIGIDEITPVICSNSEKKVIKAERLKNIIVSAMKQSIKAFGTKLNPPAEFSNFVKEYHKGTRLIAHCNNEFERVLLRSAYPAGNDAVILIGPEGDFSPQEITTANASGYLSIQLGNSRLRSETAGVAACHSIYFMNQG